MINTEQKQITPEWADKVLTEHYNRLEKGTFKQRPIHRAAINRYAADITNGSWLLSPQPIAFDEDGNLIDGQHRLEAVRKAKKTVSMMVSTGWPVSSNEVGVIDVIDSGKPRSIAAMLHMHGQLYASCYTTTLRFICRVAHVGASPLLSYSETVTLLNKMGLGAHIDRIFKQGTHVRDFQGRIVGPLAYYHTAHPKKATEFANSLFHCETTKGSPVQTFMLWCKRQNRPATDNYLKAICACIRAWHGGVDDYSSVRLNIEAVEWLSNINPDLRASIRKLVPRN